MVGVLVTFVRNGFDEGRSLTRSVPIITDGWTGYALRRLFVENGPLRCRRTDPKRVDTTPDVLKDGSEKKGQKEVSII